MRKNYIDPFLAATYVRVTWLWSNSNSVRGAAYLMSIPSFKLLSQNMYKTSPETFRWLGALLIPASELFVNQRAINCPTMTKLSRWSRHSKYKSVYQILYIMFEAMNAERCIWPIFGCKVGQSVPTGMQLELDVWHYLPGVYTKFQVSRHLEQRRGKIRKIQNAQR